MDWVGEGQQRSAGDNCWVRLLKGAGGARASQKERTGEFTTAAEMEFTSNAHNTLFHN